MPCRFGGWLGGTLSYRNQTGVDHRDANAGRWQVESREYAGSAEIETYDVEPKQPARSA